MQLPSTMQRATLIRRYKRFLADVRLNDGSELTVHCANTGAMTGLTDPGNPVWIWRSDNEKRKLPWSLEFIEMPGGLVGINTARPNQLVAEALREGAIPALAGWPDFQAEVRYGNKSRIDFLLRGPDRPDCYVEVKNVHYSRQTGLAEFPDSPTTRGARHLNEMAHMCEAGHRAVTIYVVQRTDCHTFTLCPDNDPEYVRAFAHARAAGVTALAFGCHITPTHLRLSRPLPIQIPTG